MGAPPLLTLTVESTPTPVRHFAHLLFEHDLFEKTGIHFSGSCFEHDASMRPAAGFHPS
jgi:hypothetical protein